MKKLFRILCFLMVMCVSSVSFYTSALAAESVEVSFETSQLQNTVTPTSTDGALSGWGQKTTGDGSGTFSVWTDGDYSTAAGMTLKTESKSTSGVVYLTIEKPDGTNIQSQLLFGPNQEKKYQLYFVSGGEYKVHYSVSNVTDPVTITCWIYA